VRFAGLLYSRFGPSKTEDLRDTILNAAAVSAMRDERRTRPYSLQLLAVYLMRNEAELPEEKVADYFGVPSSGIYADQRRAELMLSQNCGDLRQSVVRALEILGERICPK
jgi:hypothetical protein